MEEFMGAIGLFAFGVVPKGWMPCDGRLLSIAQNQALFSLLGTNYGGDGTTNFALPDLRGRAIVGTNAAYPLGERGGVENVVIAGGETPSHIHQVAVSSQVGNSTTLPGSVIAATATTPNLPTAPAIYAAANTGALAGMGPGSIGLTGGNLPHANMQPFQVLNYCICTTGHFPSRS